MIKLFCLRVETDRIECLLSVRFLLGAKTYFKVFCFMGVTWSLTDLALYSWRGVFGNFLNVDYGRVRCSFLEGFWFVLKSFKVRRSTRKKMEKLYVAFKLQYLSIGLGSFAKIISHLELQRIQRNLKISS